ncbi:hypothetical protein QEG73_22835 [Chitinophagaceae bacterium 26-R-25]|nr:hypothetical protein [Chitinophagaceae bacterium 26-R-25]
MKIKKTLMNTRVGRTLLTSLGLAGNQHSASYFSYRVGNSSDRQEGDYYLYFTDDKISAQAVDNFAFNEIVNLGARHGIGFLQFQVSHSENKEAFLRYLQVAIPNRKNKYPKTQHEILDYCLAWVNEQLKRISSAQSTSSNQNAIAVVNNIQIQNENEHFFSIPEMTSQFQNEIAAIKTDLKDLFAQKNNLGHQRDSDTAAGEFNHLMERMEGLENSIARLEPGSIETPSENELKQFVFLLLALQSYRIDNKPQSPYFFSQFSKVDLTGLLKSNLKHYNTKTSKTTEKDVYKFDEVFKSFDLVKIHGDLKKLLANFKFM